jgi:hypothetical protein
MRFNHLNLFKLYLPKYEDSNKVSITTLFFFLRRKLSIDLNPHYCQKVDAFNLHHALFWIERQLAKVLECRMS